MKFFERSYYIVNKSSEFNIVIVLIYYDYVSSVSSDKRLKKLPLTVGTTFTIIVVISRKETFLSLSHKAIYRVTCHK